MLYSVLDARYRRIVSPWGNKGAPESRRVAQQALGWE